MLHRTGMALLGAALCIVNAHAQGLIGTWAGGTNVTGRWLYAQAHVTGSGGNASGVLEVAGAQAAGLRMDGMTLEGERLRFSVRSPIGLISFDGTLRNDVIEGTLTGGNPGTSLHLFRTAEPQAAQSDAAVGNYELGGNQALVVTYRAFGQLAVLVLEQRGGRELARRSFIAIPVAANRYVTSGSVVQELRRDEALELERGPDGAVVAIRWSAPGGAARVARRAPGLRQVAVRFEGPAGNIAGTLFLPEGAGPDAAVAVVSGSGPASRDAVLIRAREFARIGVAALVWDKRGVGETVGDYFGASFTDLAADAAAALAYLRTRTDVDPARLGITGHSQGGWVAPMAAVQSAVPPAWLIVSSGGPIMPADQETWRAGVQSRGAGANREQAEAAAAFMRRKWDYGFTGRDWEGYLADARRAQQAPWAGVVSPILTADSMAWTHIRSLRNFDPMASPGQLRMPVLVIFGDKDDEQPVEQSRVGWLEVFRRSGHTDHEILILKGATHSLWIGEGEPRPLLSAPTMAIKRWLEAHGVARP